MLLPLRRILSPKLQRRTFYGALNVIFNSINKDRIKLVGPDRACAEWLMRNGAFVKWVGQQTQVEHYDSLPLNPEDKSVYHIEEVIANEATITHHGFPHFRGCLHVKRISFVNCNLLSDQCVDYLGLLRGSLQLLEIKHCPGLTKSGLLKISEQNLENLTSLTLSSLLEPKDLVEVAHRLQTDMPSTNVETLT